VDNNRMQFTTLPESIGNFHKDLIKHPAAEFRVPYP
jgi:hypothetical protein